MARADKRTLTDAEYEAIRARVAAFPRDDARHAALIAEWQAAHDIGHADNAAIEARDRALYKVASRHRLLKES